MNYFANDRIKFEENLPYDFCSFKPLTLVETCSHTNIFYNSFIPATVRQWNLLSASQ